MLCHNFGLARPAPPHWLFSTYRTTRLHPYLAPAARLCCEGHRPGTLLPAQSPNLVPWTPGIKGRRPLTSWPHRPETQIRMPFQATAIPRRPLLGHCSSSPSGGPLPFPFRLNPFKPNENGPRGREENQFESNQSTQGVVPELIHKVPGTRKYSSLKSTKRKHVSPPSCGGRGLGRDRGNRRILVPLCRHHPAPAVCAVGSGSRAACPPFCGPSNARGIRRQGCPQGA